VSEGTGSRSARDVAESWRNAHDVREREVRDLPCMKFRTAVVIEVYRVCCPDCGIKIEKVPQLPSKAPFSRRFEDAVGEACESAAARPVARRFGLPASMVRAIDLRYLERWAATRRKPAPTQMGVDDIHLGKKQKFITVASNVESGEPVWFGRERKKETLDEFFQTELSVGQRKPNLGGVRGHVGTVPAEYRAVGSAVPHCLRQVPHHAACQPGHR
jgi:transposase